MLPLMLLEAMRELKAGNDELRGRVDASDARREEVVALQRSSAEKDAKIGELADRVRDLEKFQQRLEEIEARLGRVGSVVP